MKGKKRRSKEKEGRSKKEQEEREGRRKGSERIARSARVCGMELRCTYIVRNGVHSVQDDSFSGAETWREREREKGRKGE
jgi:hypothetical protein